MSVTQGQDSRHHRECVCLLTSPLIFTPQCFGIVSLFTTAANEIAPEDCLRQQIALRFRLPAFFHFSNQQETKGVDDFLNRGYPDNERHSAPPDGISWPHLRPPGPQSESHAISMRISVASWIDTINEPARFTNFEKSARNLKGNKYTFLDAPRRVGAY
jgi:hypothetical protein